MWVQNSRCQKGFGFQHIKGYRLLNLSRTWLGDHSRYVKDYMKLDIPVYGSDGTQAKLETITGERINAVLPMKRFQVGNFTVTPFEVPHGADIQCFGYLIEHIDIGKLLFLTDLEYCPYNFSKLHINHILCEMNYSNEDIDNYSFNRDHVLQGHMELDTTLRLLEVNNNPALKNVILLHLSAHNSNKSKFLNKAKEVVDCPVYIAEKGIQVNLDLIPF